MHTDLILERLYRIPRRRQRRRNYFRRAQRWLFDWVRQHNWKLSLGAVVFAAWASSHIYYYNRLIDLEFNVQASWAQVEASQQKRNHVTRNLTQLLRYYAKYEQGLMTDVTKLRGEANKPEAESVSGGEGTPSEQLLRLHAIAEQYPNLHLTNTVQQLTVATVNSESEISQQIMNYNNVVNVYTTMLGQFPGNVIGRSLGFSPYSFYEPEDRKILKYNELKP